MQRRTFISIALFISGMLLLLPNFYRNRWSVVDSEYYTDWQTRYDRLVVARLVKTRQDGFFSAGGLMGIGDAKEWQVNTRTNRHQFNMYANNGEFQAYLTYKSNPGFQGVMYGVADKLLTLPAEQKLKLFRGFTAAASAIVFVFIVYAFAVELGLFSGMLVLAFGVVSVWIVLPAGSIFWSLWAFYLPFVASAYLLADATRRNEYNSGRIHAIIFIAVLMKILFSGFDLTTTVLIMATVPFVFYGIYNNWDRRTFVTRVIKIGIVLLAAALTGLIILAVQIIASEGTIANAYGYVLDRLGDHAGGSSEYFNNPNVEVREITAVEVLSKYFVMPAITIQFQSSTIQIPYWHLIAVFALFTLIFILRHKMRGAVNYPHKALGLIVATWYSLSAPLSWYLLFKPHSFIHTHVNTMAWQMPFTLLGFALCGFVLNDIFSNRQMALTSVAPLPASQTDSPLQNDTYTPRPRA